MNDYANNDNDALFDRLVDGELSTVERQQLLASLDQRENGWRQCALAFLESQAWGGEFKRMLADPTAELPAEVTLPSKSSGIPVGRWLAIAASLLIAFGFGWLTNSSSVQNQAGLEPTLAHVEREELPLREEFPEDMNTEDAVTLLVRDISGKNQRLQVPLMEVDALNDQFAGVLPAELRNRFRNQGFDVQRRRRFAPMFFEQDKQLVPMVVPVDDTRIVPVSMPVY